MMHRARPFVIAVSLLVSAWSAPASAQAPEEKITGVVRELVVSATGSSYRAFSGGGPTGFFQTGQDADILLSGIDFKNTGGPLLFNHPSSMATAGIRFIVAATYEICNSRTILLRQD